MTWDYNKKEYDKQAKADLVWRFERLINYGLGHERLPKELLKKYFPQLRIQEDRKAFLELLLWNKPF